MIHLDFSNSKFAVFFGICFEDMIDMGDLFRGESQNNMEDLVVTHALGKPSHPKKW